jgi:osmoprotectant transport system ATP-binding protein
LSALVEFRSVTYSAGGREILRDFNLSIHAGETVVLLGRSGSGKTTILRLINGLLFPSSGAVLVEGRATTDWDAVRLKRRIGYAIQETGLFPHYTVAANVGLVPRLEGWPRERIEQRVGELLRLFDLAPSDYARRYPRELSGGQKQRVGIARALAADPHLLLLDEPFGALDPVTRVEAQRHFSALSSSLRKTTVFVTHDLREAMIVGSRIVLLKDGAVDTDASPAAFRAASTPEAQAFLRSFN